MTREEEIDVEATHYDYGYYEGDRISAYNMMDVLFMVRILTMKKCLINTHLPMVHHLELRKNN